MDKEFEVLPNVERQREMRPNFRITRSCQSCKYFFPKTTIYKRGLCLIGISKPRLKIWDLLKKVCPPTHAIMVCDNHTFRGGQLSLKKLSLMFMTDKMVEKFSDLTATDE